MTDKALINLIASIWIYSGGDSTGFNYLCKDIIEKIEELEKE